MDWHSIIYFFLFIMFCISPISSFPPLSFSLAHAKWVQKNNPDEYEWKLPFSKVFVRDTDSCRERKHFTCYREIKSFTSKTVHWIWTKIGLSQRSSFVTRIRGCEWNHFTRQWDVRSFTSKIVTKKQNWKMKERLQENLGKIVKLV